MKLGIVVSPPENKTFQKFIKVRKTLILLGFSDFLFLCISI